MLYYKVLKINELLHYKMTWKKFTCLLLSERYKSEKATFWMIPTI